MREITREELKRYDGKDGRPAYIVYKGKVYDVTNSSLWKEGVHEEEHFAGADLTGEIEAAPHDEDVLENFTLVGELKTEPERVSTSQKAVRALLNRHPHPMTAHFPIAYSVSAAFFSLLYLLTRNGFFELTAYYVLVLNVATAPITVLAGLLSWRVIYLGTMTPIFSRKTQFSAVLLVISSICTIWRSLNPLILVENTVFTWVYLMLVLSLVPLVAILARYGARIVYHSPF